MSKELSVDHIMNDINEVLRKHLVSIIDKNKSDKKEFENFIKTIPFIKNIFEENEKLKKEIETHKKQIDFLNSNLSSISKKYTELFMYRNNIRFRAEVKFENLKKEEKVSDNIELIVNETKNTDNQINEEDIVKEIEKNLEKKKKDMQLGLTCNLNSNNLDDILINDLDEINNDIDDLITKSAEEEKNEENKTDFMKTILLAQKAGDYATIDTASEEEEQDEEEEEEDEEEQEEEDEEEEEKEEQDEQDEEKEEQEEQDEEEEEEEEQDEEEEEEEEDEEEEEEEDEEVVEIELEGVKYYGSEENVGKIYEYLSDGEIGDEVGSYVNGVSIIY